MRPKAAKIFAKNKWASAISLKKQEYLTKNAQKQENTGIKIPVRKKQELFEVKIEKQEKTGKTGTARGLQFFALASSIQCLSQIQFIAF